MLALTGQLGIAVQLNGVASIEAVDEKTTCGPIKCGPGAPPGRAGRQRPDEPQERDRQAGADGRGPRARAVGRGAG